MQVENTQQEQPVIIQPTIVPPRVLLELLVFGVHSTGVEPKKSDAYLRAVELQEQINKLRGKDKFMVRILWKTQELNENADEEIKNSKQWLIDTSSCKYYAFVIASFDVSIEDTYVKDKLKSIKEFEKAFDNFKTNGLNIKKK